jgi:hypothetical protein
MMEVVYRNGKAYDKSTGQRLFIKPVINEAIKTSVVNDIVEDDTNIQPIVESPTTDPTVAKKPIVRRPRKPKV